MSGECVFDLPVIGTIRDVHASTVSPNACGQITYFQLVLTTLLPIPTFPPYGGWTIYANPRADSYRPTVLAARPSRTLGMHFRLVLLSQRRIF